MATYRKQLEKEFRPIRARFGRRHCVRSARAQLRQVVLVGPINERLVAGDLCHTLDVIVGGSTGDRNFSITTWASI
jgi:hypothetical protein